MHIVGNLNEMLWYEFLVWHFGGVKKAVSTQLNEVNVYYVNG